MSVAEIELLEFEPIVRAYRYRRKISKRETRNHMANFRTHLGVASGLGFIYGGVAVNQFHIDPAVAAMGGILTGIGGVLPDLDHDGGIPVREMFNLAGILVPVLLMPRLQELNYSQEQIILIMAAIYLFIRHGLSRIFKRISVHRGMYHSVPAMLIAGMAIFLIYHHANLHVRLFMGCGVMLGFLSHLILDEIYSVDFQGVRIHLKSSAGSALKFWSPSFLGSAICYVILGAISFFTFREVERVTKERITIPILEEKLNSYYK